MKKIVLFLVILLVLCGCSKENMAKVEDVTCNEEKEILKDSTAMLIDVRSKEEFDEGHLKNAINIAYDQIVSVLDTYGTIDFNTPIVVYCKSGARSSAAAEALLKAGYKNIYNLGAMSNCEG